jgi:hypothetical protein
LPRKIVHLDAKSQTQRKGRVAKNSTFFYAFFPPGLATDGSHMPFLHARPERSGLMETMNIALTHAVTPFAQELVISGGSGRVANQDASPIRARGAGATGGAGGCLRLTEA